MLQIGRKFIITKRKLDLVVPKHIYYIIFRGGRRIEILFSDSKLIFISSYFECIL